MWMLEKQSEKELGRLEGSKGLGTICSRAVRRPEGSKGLGITYSRALEQREAHSRIQR